MNPPPPTTANTNRRRGHPLAWLAGLVTVIITARLLLQWNVPVPPCGFKILTDWPCLLCGGTRTLQSLAELNLIAAAKYNPLVLLVTGLVCGWILIRLFDHFRGSHLSTRLKELARKLPLFWIGLTLVILNWIYLIWSLP